MKHYSDPIAYLVSFEDEKDVLKIDEAISAKKLGFDKIGRRAYLVFLFESPSSFSQNQMNLNLDGGSQWIRLGSPEELK
jgi:hypothetical protein